MRFLARLGPAAAAMALAAAFSVSSARAADVVCGSAVSSCVLKTSGGNLLGIYANCTSACWVMLFNAVAAPSNGATTAGKLSGNMIDCFPVAAGGANSLTYYDISQVDFSVGITAAISSTACATLTLSAVGFVHGTVR